MTKEADLLWLDSTLLGLKVGTSFKIMKKKMLFVAILVVFASCRTTSNVPHGCGKKSKRYYHGEFLEYK